MSMSRNTDKVKKQISQSASYDVKQQQRVIDENVENSVNKKSIDIKPQKIEKSTNLQNRAQDQIEEQINKIKDQQYFEDIRPVTFSSDGEMQKNSSGVIWLLIPVVIGGAAAFYYNFK